MIEVGLLYSYFLVIPVVTLLAICWIDRQTKTQFNMKAQKKKR